MDFHCFCTKISLTLNSFSMNFFKYSSLYPYQRGDLEGAMLKTMSESSQCLWSQPAYAGNIPTSDPSAPRISSSSPPHGCQTILAPMSVWSSRWIFLIQQIKHKCLAEGSRPMMIWSHWPVLFLPVSCCRPGLPPGANTRIKPQTSLPSQIAAGCCCPKGLAPLSSPW